MNAAKILRMLVKSATTGDSSDSGSSLSDDDDSPKRRTSHKSDFTTSGSSSESDSSVEDSDDPEGDPQPLFTPTVAAAPGRKRKLGVDADSRPKKASKSARAGKSIPPDFVYPNLSAILPRSAPATPHRHSGKMVPTSLQHLVGSPTPTIGGKSVAAAVTAVGSALGMAAAATAPAPAAPPAVPLAAPSPTTSIVGKQRGPRKATPAKAAAQRPLNSSGAAETLSRPIRWPNDVANDCIKDAPPSSGSDALAIRTAPSYGILFYIPLACKSPCLF
ncbi:uncharacterized protein BJ171DRAFT_471752 [Polychytrium aggregatum]|uniref:uncharacterized protein n=1 Tax=Polychytrium aggregatum TaxID=110093 RepID=UPI0022FE3339|nr:uncharacterized protein BJ171DRAFT_471752 [Polychytrium aggregatum]KAI9208778.1 hypothetical protein BJ171DRAFT_471752 [Polychytrium aggregatum]